MQMTFQVGQHERHEVMFSFNKFWGRLKITVDGESIVDTVRVASVHRTRTWEFQVGVREVHRVRIDKHRAAAFAGFRPQPVLAYVDGVLVMRRDA